MNISDIALEYGR